MATLSITEIVKLAIVEGDVAQVGRPSTMQSVTVVTANAQSTVVGNVEAVRLCSDVNCRIAIGEDPTASASTTYLPANTVEYFGVVRGKSKVGVLLA